MYYTYILQIVVKDKAYKKALKEYFDNNLLDGFIKIELFTLGKDNFGCGEIIPLVPNVDEYYEGGNNSDIEKICKKHDVNFKMAYWCYSK